MKGELFGNIWIYDLVQWCHGSQSNFIVWFGLYSTPWNDWKRLSLYTIDHWKRGKLVGQINIPILSTMLPTCSIWRLTAWKTWRRSVSLFRNICGPGTWKCENFREEPHCRIRVPSNSVWEIPWAGSFGSDFGCSTSTSRRWLMRAVLKDVKFTKPVQWDVSVAKSWYLLSSSLCWAVHSSLTIVLEILQRQRLRCASFTYPAVPRCS